MRGDRVKSTVLRQPVRVESFQVQNALRCFCDLRREASFSSAIRLSHSYKDMLFGQSSGFIDWDFLERVLGRDCFEGDFRGIPFAIHLLSQQVRLLLSNDSCRYASAQTPSRSPLTAATLMSDIETEWTLNALLTTSNS
jgi:hypothetical protein